MNTASSIDNTPRQRMPGVGQALWKVSDAFRRKSAAASPSDALARPCRIARSIIAYPPSRAALRRASRCQVSGDTGAACRQERVTEGQQPDGCDEVACRRRNRRRHGDNQRDDLHDADRSSPRSVGRQRAPHPGPQPARRHEQVPQQTRTAGPTAPLCRTPREDGQHQNQRRVGFHVEARSKRADRACATRHPAVDAVEQRRDDGDGHDAPCHDRRRRLTDEACEPRDQHGAKER